MVFDLFKRFGQESDTRMDITPANGKHDPTIYKGKKLYHGDEYLGIIDKVGYVPKTGQIVHFKVIRKIKTEESIIIKDDRVILIDQKNENPKANNEDKPIEEKKIEEKKIEVGDPIDELIHEIEFYAKVIADYNNKINNAIETLINYRSDEDTKKYIHDYIARIREEKDEKVKECKVKLSELMAKREELERAMRGAEQEAKNLELNGKINGLSPNDERKIAMLNDNAKRLNDRLKELYAKEAEYKRLCSD